MHRNYLMKSVDLKTGRINTNGGTMTPKERFYNYVDTAYGVFMAVTDGIKKLGEHEFKKTERSKELFNAHVNTFAKMICDDEVVELMQDELDNFRSFQDHHMEHNFQYFKKMVSFCAVFKKNCELLDLGTEEDFNKFMNLNPIGKQLYIKIMLGRRKHGTSIR